MDRKDYEVEWNACGVDFNYRGEVIVFASDEDDAKERAIQRVSKDMLMSRHLIAVKSVRVI